ncbi:MAG: helix-turn-helix domain-containing protein [Planctomycetota bacterium]|jgi:AraC-like DNA-binding protein|nr:helix-turn-helix domain-containing protein [Planctomycetota bacterium]
MSQRGRIDFLADRDELPLPGLRHIGWSQFVAASPGSLDAHAHAGAYEVCLILRGTLRWWVGDGHFTVRAGHVFMTLPDEIHGGDNAIMDPCELLWVSFDCSQDLGITPEQAAAIDQRLRSAAHRGCRAPDGLATHYHTILKAQQTQTATSALQVRGGLALLLAGITAAYTTPEPALAERPRIEAAKNLLTADQASVTEIALRCGFNSSAWFATAFRQRTGFSPRAWREHHA